MVKRDERSLLEHALDELGFSFALHLARGSSETKTSKNHGKNADYNGSRYKEVEVMMKDAIFMTEDDARVIMVDCTKGCARWCCLGQ